MTRVLDRIKSPGCASKGVGHDKMMVAGGNGGMIGIWKQVLGGNLHVWDIIPARYTPTWHICQKMQHTRII